MSLKDTMSYLGNLLTSTTKDLMKVHRGNRTAAQRVRVDTIKLEKIAKIFRKESVEAEKSGKFKRKMLGKAKKRNRKESRFS